MEINPKAALSAAVTVAGLVFGAGQWAAHVAEDRKDLEEVRTVVTSLSQQITVLDTKIKDMEGR